MTRDEVYERILARVDPGELGKKCRDVVQREGRLIERRIRGTRRALQHVCDVNAATKLLPVESDQASTLALLDDIDRLNALLAEKLKLLGARASQGSVAGLLSEESSIEVKFVVPKVEHQPAATATAAVELTSQLPTPVQRTGRKRRLSHESFDSPRKPPRPGRLVIADEDTIVESSGPHGSSNADSDDTEDECPVELDVLDSDSEVDMAAFLEKARRLRKLSSERRMSELPGLIQSVLYEVHRQEWKSIPRDLLGVISATFGATTTLKPRQRDELRDELGALKLLALRIDDATARRYPTLTGTKARFLSSLSNLGIETPRDEIIEVLCAATAELEKAVGQTNDGKTMEEIEAILQLAEHVFDNPTVARSDRYKQPVARSLSILIDYVRVIPRRTRRSLQCEEMLIAWHGSLQV